MSLVLVAPSLVFNSDELLACECGTQQDLRGEEKPAIIATFKGREYSLRFICDDPAAAIRNLCQPRDAGPQQ